MNESPRSGFLFYLDLSCNSSAENPQFPAVGDRLAGSRKLVKEKDKEESSSLPSSYSDRSGAILGKLRPLRSRIEHQQAEKYCPLLPATKPNLQLMAAKGVLF